MKFNQISDYLNREFLGIHKKSSDIEIYHFYSKHFKLPIAFKSLAPQKLFQVFTHKSFHHESGKRFPHNEQLEFLGDAVLELIVSEILMEEFSHLSEGQMSKFRSSIVNETTLGELAKNLGLDKFILLGKGELKSNGNLKQSILSDSFEAVLGGYYQTFGLSDTRDFFKECIHYQKSKFNIDILRVDVLQDFDAKSRLQEITMKSHKSIPTYLCEEKIENGVSGFFIRCLLAEKELGSDFYTSKKKGMQSLAKTILETNKIQTEKACY